MEKTCVGIKIDMLVSANSNKDITDVELDSFLYEVIELIERRNWGVMGGMNKADVETGE